MISRDRMEKGHDQNTLQCRIKVKELRNAYCKANSCSSAAPLTCLFYKELDAILEGDPTSPPSTTMDTSEPSSTRQEEEGDTLTSLAACSQELFSSQEEGSQSQWLVLGEGQTPEEVSYATLRSQLSVLSLAKRLQRIKKRPRRSKEDMLHEVMQQSLNEKAQEWQERERRVHQQNADRWHQSMEQLPSIMEHEADTIQVLVAMQAEHYHAHPPCSPCPKTFPCAPISPPTHSPPHLGSYCHQLPLTPIASPPRPTTLTYCTQPPLPCILVTW